MEQPREPTDKKTWHGKKKRTTSKGEIQFLNKLWIKVTKGKIMSK